MYNFMRLFTAALNNEKPSTPNKFNESNNELNLKKILVVLNKIYKKISGRSKNE